MAVRGKPSASREEAAADVAKGAWEGTQELVMIIADESRYTYGWRPARAAALAALRDSERPEDGSFMSGAEFEAWRTDAKAVARVRGDGSPLDRLGITTFTARTMEKEGANKVVALACAHYLLGLPMPIPAGDPRAFDEWFRPRFGSAERVADWLNIKPVWISQRLAGFENIRGERQERLPPAYLIRALDWLANVGPVCPYGAKTHVPLWPGQDLEEGY